MCSASSNDQTRHIGSAEDALRQGNSAQFKQLGGFEGDKYRQAQASLETTDLTANPGIFQIQAPRNPLGASDLITQAPNPFYMQIRAPGTAPTPAGTTQIPNPLPR